MLPLLPSCQTSGKSNISEGLGWIDVNVVVALNIHRQDGVCGNRLANTISLQ